MKLLSEKLGFSLEENQLGDTPTLYDMVRIKDGSECDAIFYGATGQIEGKQDGKMLVNFDKAVENPDSDDLIQNEYFPVECLEKIGGLAESFSKTKEKVREEKPTVDNLKKAAMEADTSFGHSYEHVVFTIKPNAVRKYQREIPEGFIPVFVPLANYYQSDFWGAPISQHHNTNREDPIPVSIKDIDKILYGVLPYLDDSIVWSLYETQTPEGEPLNEGFTDSEIEDLHQMVRECEGKLTHFLNLPIMENRTLISRTYRQEPFEHIIVTKGDDKFIIAESKRFKSSQFEYEAVACGLLGDGDVIIENQVDVLAGYERGDSTYVIEVSSVDGISATPFDQQDEIGERTHFKDFKKSKHPYTLMIGLYNTFNRMFKIIYCDGMAKRYHMFADFTEGYGDEDKIESAGKEVERMKKPMMVRLGGLDIDEITKQSY